MSSPPPAPPGRRARLGAAAATPPGPGCRRARNPPPFWAMESLLREYPISSAEGLALMRLAEALLRVPDAETAIALTADQLGRADFRGARRIPRCSRALSAAISMSKSFLPEGDHAPVHGALGARTVVAATLRAVQLLGRQFVLGQTIAEAMDEADGSRKRQAPCASATTCWAKARAPTPMRCATWPATRMPSTPSPRADAARPEHNDGISIKLSALHPRYEDAQRERVMPNWCRACGAVRAAAARQHQPHHRRRRGRPAGTVARRVRGAGRAVAQQHPSGSGFGLALQAYQTRALELIEHVTPSPASTRPAPDVPPGQGRVLGRGDQARAGAGLPHYPVFTHKHHTDVSYLACARRCWRRPTRSIRSSPLTTPAPSPPSCRWPRRPTRAFRVAAPARHGRGRVSARC
jgi:RHH-type proline utilization regulon transcriptional repressor/proline dehydrogenase/delta 1-pyrroline-5-carboxylate dehydrogenase